MMILSANRHTAAVNHEETISNLILEENHLARLASPLAGLFGDRFQLSIFQLVEKMDAPHEINTLGNLDHDYNSSMNWLIGAYLVP
jgi:hypothetical protein